MKRGEPEPDGVQQGNESRNPGEPSVTDQPPPGEVTRLLKAMRQGDNGAEAKLIPLVYGELRRLAAHYLSRERRDHTLQATALVHEAYLRLAGQHMPWQNRAHFFGVAAQLMRRVLIDYARAQHAHKRGGDDVKIPLDESLRLSAADSRNLLDLDVALSRLERFDARIARVFDLRFFGGLSVDETAGLLSVGPRTVNRDWRMAQAWLRREIGGIEEGHDLR